MDIPSPEMTPTLKPSRGAFYYFRSKFWITLVLRMIFLNLFCTLRQFSGWGDTWIRTFNFLAFKLRLFCFYWRVLVLVNYVADRKQQIDNQQTWLSETFLFFNPQAVDRTENFCLSFLESGLLGLRWLSVLIRGLVTSFTSHVISGVKISQTWFMVRSDSACQNIRWVRIS